MTMTALRHGSRKVDQTSSKRSANTMWLYLLYVDSCESRCIMTR